MADLSWDFVIDVPENWYVWDPDPDGRASRDAVQVNARIATRPELAAHRDQILEVLAGFAATADASRAYAAATRWEPGERVPEVAHVMVAGAARHSPHSGEEEVAHFRRSLSSPGPSDVAPRAADEVALPCGPAVRLRGIMRAPGAAPGDPTVVLDTIQYWVPVPGREEMVVVSATTPSLARRDDFAEVVATIAHSLRFTYANLAR